jgi:exopolysaccharide production protein ExoQ
VPPTVALLLGLALAAFCILRAARTEGGFPLALLWPSLWYMVCSSRPFGSWMVEWNIRLPLISDLGGEGSPMDQFFYLSLILLGWQVLARRSLSLAGLFRENRWPAMLLLLMAASILWSDYSFTSFKRYIKVVGSLTMVLVILTDERPYTALQTVLRTCLYVHLPLSIICVKYFRQIGIEYSYMGTSHFWQGIATSKNTMGQVAMLGLVYFSWDLAHHWRTQGWRRLNTLFLLMSVYLLKGSNHGVSKTSILVALLAVSILFLLHKLRPRPESLFRFTNLMLVGGLTLVAFIITHSIVAFKDDSFLGTVVKLFGRDITLTDRLYIWQDMYRAASGNPLLGVGYGGFWIGREANIPWNTHTWVLGQGHSGYVDTYLQLGIAGWVVLFGLVLTTHKRLVASLSEGFDFAAFRLTLFIVVLFVNLTETTLLRGDHHLWFIFTACIWQVPAPATAPAWEEQPAEEAQADEEPQRP